MSSPTLYSERLVLRKFTKDDAQALFDILKEEAVNTFLPWFVHKTIEESETFLQERFLRYDHIANTYKYAICLKQSNQVIGYIQIGEADSYDLGYGIAQSYWHQGIASEAATTLLAQLVKDGFPYITATHDRNNPHSGEVMKKIGMSYRYSYEECVQPKKQNVIFRLYQLNIQKQVPTYRTYWNRYPNHFVEEGI